jgi:hypothetical protein
MSMRGAEHLQNKWNRGYQEDPVAVLKAHQTGTFLPDKRGADPFRYNDWRIEALRTLIQHDEAEKHTDPTGEHQQESDIGRASYVIEDRQIAEQAGQKHFCGHG